MWYMLKQLITTVTLKVVDIYRALRHNIHLNFVTLIEIRVHLIRVKPGHISNYHDCLNGDFESKSTMKRTVHEITSVRQKKNGVNRDIKFRNFLRFSLNSKCA